MVEKQTDIIKIDDADELIEKYTNLYTQIKKYGFKENETIAIFQEIGKELRMKIMSNNKLSDKPTDKQIKFAKDLGILNPEKMTKQELSKEIDTIRKK